MWNKTLKPFLQIFYFKCNHGLTGKLFRTHSRLLQVLKVLSVLLEAVKTTFTGQMLFPLPNQRYQIVKDNCKKKTKNQNFELPTSFIPLSVDAAALPRLPPPISELSKLFRPASEYTHIQGAFKKFCNSTTENNGSNAKYS